MRIAVPQLAAALEPAVFTLWIGSMWTIGFIVAPVLFLSLPDPMTAGAIAGRLFRIGGYIGLICSVLLLAAAFLRESGAALRSWRVQVLFAMLVITAVGQFGLLPQIEHLKDLAGGRLIAGSALERQFGRLHAVSSTLFVVNSVLGLVLAVRGLYRPGRRG